ncbi:PWWP domain [Macleaya cordata]|uniref:PWWP domain n=1 Tax=Macleaya cordata TaxID=56857 RepID=A0A200R6Y8_MACCD|nr:PWWP domain [Macleaya cordata]
MGISDGLQGSGGEVDCSVGTIVWVRRRNGSWWPGRILGANELSDSHLMSPRSGTPVKLLGREDASVDWYNLEKSKRVKAFRCGEFDDCIERAESSQGAPIKKREKYARREDAILHALELERQLLEKKQQKLGTANYASNKVPIGPKKELGGLKKELGIPSGNLGKDNCKSLNLKSQSLSKGLDSSEEDSMDTPLRVQIPKHGKQLNWEDDNSEATPRMRGLQDFGLRTASLKRKPSASVASEGPQRSFSVDNVQVLPSGSRSLGGADHASSSKNLLTLKRKRTPVALIEESPVKKRDRRRPLVQVLKSSAKLPVCNPLQSDGDVVSISMRGEKEQIGGICRAKRSQCVYLPAASNDCLDHTEFPSDEMQISPSQFETDNRHLHPDSSTEENSSSGLMEEAESDSSECDYLNPDIDEETAVLSDSSPILTDTGPRNSGRYLNNYHVQGQTGSTSSEELDESAVTAHISHLHPRDQTGAGTSDAGVSKWQLKGKRNIRHLMKRPMEMDGNSSNGLIRRSHFEGKGRNKLNRRALGQGFYRGTEDLRYDYAEDDLIEKNPMHNHVLGFGNRRYQSMLKVTSKDIDSEEDLVWDVNGLSQASLKGYWDESDECFSPGYVGHRSGNRKEPMLVDVDLKVQATSYQGEHVPLVSLMSRLNGKAIIGHPVQIETLEDGSSDLLLSTNNDFGEEPAENDGSTALTPVWRTARRTVMHRIPRPHPSKALEKKSSKKLLKKVSLSSQKTRTLSSIATQQKLNKLSHQKSVNGLIKPEETGPTTITCIPVKLAFSRLMEAVGRPPSRTANPCVSANGDTERRPS